MRTIAFTLLLTSLTLGPGCLFEEAEDDEQDSGAQVDAGPPPAADAAATPTDGGTPAADAGGAEDGGARMPDAASPSPCPEPGQAPFPEVCNAFDDDCDGVMDEGVCDDPCDVAW